MASNPIEEENYNIVHWLNRIGSHLPMRFGFVRDPAHVSGMYGDMMRGKKYLRTNADIQTAVNLWCSNRAVAEERYGHISMWDVSSVTNMNGLFEAKDPDRGFTITGKDVFNDDITRWDVSNVTNMANMFAYTDKFNQPIGEWDVSNVTNMGGMFYYSAGFNQPIGGWDVSNVTNMGFMFNGANKFNQYIGEWDVSNVTNMMYMFSSVGYTFNQPIGNWDVSNVTNMEGMFDRALSFNQDLTRWNVANVINNKSMFLSCPISNTNKPARFRGGGAKNRWRASRKGTRSRKGRRTMKRGARRIRRR